MAGVYLAGSGAFGRAVAARLTEDGHTLVGVSAPPRGRRGGADLLASWATYEASGVPLRAPGGGQPPPPGTDVIVAAHSHEFVGVEHRRVAREAIGYHPSLLPLHRGRDAVRWAVRMGDRVTGGSVYHLSDSVDGGDIVSQRHVIVPPGASASELWRYQLFPLGVDMLAEAVSLSDVGPLPGVPQDESLATWEPSIGRPPLHRPGLRQIRPPGGGYAG